MPRTKDSKNSKENNDENSIKSKSVRRLFFVLYFTMAMLSVVLFVYSWFSNMEIAEKHARSVSYVAKSSLDIEKLSLLRGVSQDENTEEYKSIQSNLHNIATGDDEIIFAYLYTQRDGKLYYLADSEPLSSALYAPPGQEYSIQSYYKPLENNKIFITPVIKDRRGSRVSILSPLINDSGDFIAVLGLDYPVVTWYMPSIIGCAKTLMIVLAIFLLAMAIHALMNRNNWLNASQIKFKKANERIRNSEEKYRNIFEYAPVGIFNFDKNALIVDCNDYFVNTIGSSREALVGLDLLSLPDQEMVKCIKAVLQGEATEYRDTYQSMTSDKKIPIRGLFSPILSNTGAIIGGTGIIEDITQRKKLGDELRLKSLVLDQLEERITLTDLDGNITYVNKIQAETMGLTAQEMIGRKTDIYGEDADKGASQKEILEITLKEGSWHCEVVNYFSGGQELFMDCRTQVVCNVEGEKVALAGIATDITHRKRIEKELYDEKEQFRTTLLSIGDGVIATDAKANITLLNAIAQELTGFTQKEANGKPLEEVFHIINELSGKRPENPAHKVLSDGKNFQLSEDTILIARDGTQRYIEDSAAPIKSKKGDIQGVVLAFRDISEKRKKQQEIEYLSLHDQLTGLHNRRFYEQEVQRLDREKYYPLTLVMSDVNGLKLTNDAFGHKAGDLLLQRIAEIMRRECRTKDIVARIGGDEFVLLLPKTDAMQAETIIERINAAIAEEKAGHYVMSIAVGYAVKENDSVSMDEVFTKAEDAMYRNKLSGSSNVQSKTIHQIMDSLFAKNERELFHSKRVGELCESIATEMGFSQPDIDQIRLAGLMHDIGKIGVSETILNKKGAVAPNEWNEIERHSEIGYRILGSVNEFSKIADYVLEHHERLDGKGYPRGLTDTEISLQGKIIALADAYDTMTSDNPYKAALSKDEALEEIKKHSGTQFDRNVAEVFIEMVLGEKWSS
ncbi:MAG TPA: PAS domain S-box protein [Clostridia bacterium]|nr:PAS domain S-box protein [Clostridia bacterium]